MCLFGLWVLLQAGVFALYKIDKQIARNNGRLPEYKQGGRVPEYILITSALFGPLGALLGIYLRPRHKTSPSKLWFRIRVFVVAVMHFVVFVSIILIALAGLAGGLAFFS